MTALVATTRDRDHTVYWIPFHIGCACHTYTLSHNLSPHCLSVGGHNCTSNPTRPRSLYVPRHHSRAHSFICNIRTTSSSVKWRFPWQYNHSILDVLRLCAQRPSPSATCLSHQCTSIPPWLYFLVISFHPCCAVAEHPTAGPHPYAIPAISR